MTVGLCEQDINVTQSWPGILKSLHHLNLSAMAANNLLVYIIKYPSLNNHAQKLTIMYVILMSSQDDAFFKTLHPWIGISHPNHEAKAK